MSNFDNQEEFSTRKFDLSEIAKAEGEKDFSLNPEAKKFYGEEYKKAEENVSYKKNSEKTKNENKKKALIAAILVFVIGMGIFFGILIKMTYRNDVFYVSPDNNKTDLERQEPKKPPEEVPEKIEEPKPSDKPEEKKESPYKSCVGTYVFKSTSEEMGDLTYNVYVSNISDEGEILFSVALMNSDSSVMYETGTITSKLSDNKAEFKWGDNHGNSGIGELVLNFDNVSIMLIESETSEGNLLSLATDNPITIPKLQ